MFLEKRKIITMLIITIITIVTLATFSIVKAEENTTIRVEYEYNEEENEVIAKIISDIELKDTKPTWELSADKKEYTKKFTSNMNYETAVEDINGNITNVNIVITQIQPLMITMEYEYNEEENTVTAKMISNIELKHTKPTWTLSKNKKEYTKVFSNNMNYATQVEDINGKRETVNIVITQIQPLAITMEYEYNEEENTVTAKMISNTELKDTKPTWILSQNKKEYTKTFSENMNYSTQVEDINGNKENVHIQVTQVIMANLKVDYQYDDVKNIVTVNVISDLELKDTKPSWNLSEDKLIYTKVFEDNMHYSTVFVDSYNHNINLEINVQQIDKTPPKITLEYKYNKEDTVTISMKSNEKLGDTKPTWSLSEDKLTYAKTFSTDQDYTTPVQDIYGNVTNVYIKLKKKRNIYPQSDGSTITVGYMYTSYKNVIVQITSSVQLQDTKPSWELSDDKYTYTKIFTDDIEYLTPVVDINGREKSVYILVDYFFNIIYESGVYGYSGAAVRGVTGGTALQYLRFGNGNNVLFATFCVHGFEDSWFRDGTVLTSIADNFYSRLVNDKDKDLAKKWTIYILREVNPDGRRLGTTNNGPGRTTLYSSIGRGMDINRSWQTGSSYTRYTDNRDYNGTEGFQAYEAAYLRDFLLSHKSNSGQTVVVDLHGWENQLIGNSQICNYYKQQYPSCSTKNYENYGTQYLITWARQNLGAKAALVELPYASNSAQVNSMDLSNKYINATLNMLRGI